MSYSRTDESVMFESNKEDEKDPLLEEDPDFEVSDSVRIWYLQCV